MADVEAVLFDLDLTLVRMNVDVRDRLVARVCNDLAARHRLDAVALIKLQSAVTLDRWRQFQDTLLASPSEAPDGLSIMRSIWVEALGGCGCNDEAVVEEAFELYWQNRAGTFTPYRDAIEVLEALQGNVPMAVITNGPSITQLDKLEVLKLDHYFEVFVASGDAGSEKPNPAIFEVVLDKLGVHARNAYHVGDSLTSDVAGALAAGINAIWLNRKGEIRRPDQPKPDAEIADLRELLPLLGLES